MGSKGQQTRDHIIATAAPIFNVAGFAGASLSAIQEATGLERGGLYRHFENKDALALAAFDYAVRVLEARYDNAQAGQKSALERLHASITVVAESVHAPAIRGGCPILNTAIEADDTHAALRKRAASAMKSWQARLAQLVTNGVATGELLPSTDPRAIAAILTSALEGAIMTTALLRDYGQMGAVAQHLHTFVDGLRAKNGRR